MTDYFSIHPDNPQKRLVNQVVEHLKTGSVIVYPTDSCYALGCRLGNKSALERICKIRGISPSQNMTLLCQDLSEISVYAHLDNSAFRMIKSMTPGPYTFILRAKRDIPKRLQHPKKRTIGIRIPDNIIILALLSNFGEPIISSSLVLPDSDLPETDPEEIKNKLAKLVDIIIDGGAGGLEYTTVIDLSEKQPVLIRRGKGLGKIV